MNKRELLIGLAKIADEHYLGDIDRVQMMMRFSEKITLYEITTKSGVLDDVSVTSAVLRDMAEAVNRDYCKNGITVEDGFSAREQANALILVADLLEKRS